MKAARSQERKRRRREGGGEDVKYHPTREPGKARKPEERMLWTWPC